MSIIARYNQQPGENRKYMVSYSSWLEDGEVLNNVTTDVSPSGLTVTGVTIDPVTSDNVVFYVSGGTDGVEYKVTLSADTTDKTKESEVIYRIKEV